MDFVFVMPAEKLPSNIPNHGLVPFTTKGLTRPGVVILDTFLKACNKYGFFAERDFVETRPEYQQIIPYTVVKSPQGILLMTRLPTGDEARLHNKLSIGAGGHINPIDADGCRDSFAQIIANNTERELHKEEINASGERSLKLYGLLNHDDDVSSVHIGLVQVLTVNGDVSVRETEIMEGENIRASTLKKLRAEGANFEGWSEIVIDQIDYVIAADIDPLHL